MPYVQQFAECTVFVAPKAASTIYFLGCGSRSMFAEAAAGIFHARVQKERLTRLGVGIGDNLLDCLHEASLRGFIFSKGVC